MTALARLFGSLANTLLDLGLPRIRAWLRERVGPAADVTQVSTEGSFIHLDGVRLPIGDRGELVLDRATAAITAARGRGGVLPEIRLHAFRGVLRFTSPARASGQRADPSDGEDAGAGDELHAEVLFAASQEAEEAAWVSGELTIVKATWSAQIAREGTPLHEPMEGRARLVVTSTAWTLDEGSLTSAHARVRFSGRGATGAADDAHGSGAGGALEVASLALDGARVGPFVDAVQAMMGRALAVPPGVPLDARLSGDLGWDARSGGTCNIQMTAEGLDARVSGIVGPDARGLAARIDGTVAPAVPMKRAKLPAAVFPRDDDRLVVAIEATGDAARPDVVATLRAAELGFRFGRPRFQPALVARSIEVEVRSAGELAHVRASGRIGQGTLTAEGEVPLRVRDGRRLTAKLVDLEPVWVTSLVNALAPEIRLVTEVPGTVTPKSPDGITFVLPRDARIGADVTFALEDSVRAAGEITVATPRSSVALRPFAMASSKSLEGTRLVGTLAAADALTLGLFPFDIRPQPVGTATLDLALRGPMNDLVLGGPITSPSLRITITSRPDVPPFVLDDIATCLTVDRRMLRYSDGRFRAYGGTFHAEGAIPFEPAPAAAPAPSLVLQARDASAALAEAVASLARGRLKVRAERDGERPENELWIPRTSRISGELRLARDLTTSAEIALETAQTTGSSGSTLLSTFALSPTLRVDGSSIRGTLSLADAITCGAFQTTLRPLPEGAARVEVTLKGPIDDCVLSGFATVPHVRFGTYEKGCLSETAPIFVATDLSALFRLDTAKLVWQRLEARVYGGSLTSSGLIGFSGAFVGLQSTLSLRDVSLGHLPIGATGAMVADFARGRLALDMRFDRQGTAGPVVGRGQAQLDEAAFPVLARSKPALAKYGIAPPAENAVAPATLMIGLDPVGWSFTQARGAVPGCEASGDIRVAFDGTMNGALVVTLGEELLASSAVLVVPSILAEKLTLPVRIGGTITQPHIDADLGACLGRFVTDNRVTEFFSEAASDVVSLFTGRGPTRPPPPQPPAAMAPQHVHHAQDEDALLRELVASGADWDEIEERLQEHRRGGVRHRIG
jgi:hypothetical protein